MVDTLDMQEVLHSPVPDARPNVFARFKAAFQRGGSVYEVQKAPTVTVPETIRYALGYKEGVFGRAEASALIENNFQDIATYILLKATDANPFLQQQFLETLTGAIMSDADASGEAIAQAQRGLLSQLGEAFPAVPASKLGKLFVQGTELWEERFGSIAGEIKATEGAVPVYVAYAGSIGIRQGIETFSGSGIDPIMLMPTWFDDPKKGAGYLFHLNQEEGQRVSVLPKDFKKPESYFFIDDSKSTGENIKKVWDFWEEGRETPFPEERLKIVFNVSTT